MERSYQRRRGALRGGQEQSEMEVSDQRLRGAITGGGMQSEVERSNQRWSLGGGTQKWREAI